MKCTAKTLVQQPRNSRWWVQNDKHFETSSLCNVTSLFENSPHGMDFFPDPPTPPLWKFQSHLWGEYGYFLELYISNLTRVV